MATEVRPTRKDTWTVTVDLNGSPTGIWDVKTGGEIDSDTAEPYRPGGMGEAIAMGGSVKTGNLTLSRMCRLERDWDNLQTLINAAGKGTVVVKQSAMDIDGNDYHKSNPLTYRGVLNRVTPPEHDSNAQDAALIEIEIVIDGKPTFGGGSGGASSALPGNRL